MGKVARIASGLTVVWLAAVAPGAAQSNGNRFPDLGECEKLAPPEGSKVVVRVFAAGFQIYRWSGTSWTFVAPAAVLFAGPHGKGPVGIHYAGPAWQSVSGSKVVGAVQDRCTPDASAIPWLLLGAVSSEGPGIFDRVKFIQRLNTTGGNAPSTPGTAVDEIARVFYTADYVFYRAP
jgi:hypothetical protein